MDGFCLKLGGLQTRKENSLFQPASILIFFFSRESSLVHILHWQYSSFVKVRYPPSIQSKLYFIRVECDIKQQT